MLLDFEKIIDGVYRLCVPFENLDTAVFAVKCDDGFAVIDCATTVSDVADVILPALERLGALQSTNRIFLTHLHSDHTGGLDEMRRCLPNASVCMSKEAAANGGVENACGLSDGEIVGTTLKAMLLPGHTGDCMGYLHIPSGVLISGDCVQQYGIKRYGCGLERPSLYRRSLERLLADRSILGIVPSHEYTPIGRASLGRTAFEEHIKTCLSYDDLARSFVKKCAENGITNPDEMAQLFKKLHADLLPGELMLPPHTIYAYANNL